MTAALNEVYLEEPQKNDLKTLLSWENNPKIWSVSDTLKPYTDQEMLDFIETNQKDIRETHQKRWMIRTRENSSAVGCIDLFDADHQQAWVGVLIDENYRKKGYALNALLLLEEMAFSILGFTTLKAKVHAHNLASMNLFEKAGFVREQVNVDEGTQIFILLK